MKKLILVAVGGLLLATASSPPPAASGYPPCSAKATDRCSQTYERGKVRGRAAATAPRAGAESELSSVVAAEAPGRTAAPAPAAPARTYRAPAAHRGAQLALRAGERG